MTARSKGLNDKGCKNWTASLPLREERPDVTGPVRVGFFPHITCGKKYGSYPEIEFPHTLMRGKATVCHEVLKTLNVLMILPQVHLRKPCYDFYFL
jgi:hypothetical protein